MTVFTKAYPAPPINEKEILRYTQCDIKLYCYKNEK